VPEAELATFYRGLCLKLTIQLDRTRTECIRISRLKALTDTDALMMIYDEREQLRQHSTKIFGLPESEKMVLASKCFLSTEEESEQHLRRRLIILTNFLVMDTAIFGPTISSTGSSLLRIDQLFDVSDSEQGGGTENRLETASHSFYLKTVNDVGNSQSWKIAFATASTAHQVRMSLSDMCSRARHLRQMLRDRPFEDNVVKRLIEKVGMIHYLVEGQELVEARSSDSLFLVRSGGVTQRCDKLVYRMLREGSCFGETNFAKGCISSQFSVHANTDAVVVELRRELVRSLTESDQHLCLRFWYTFCQVLNRGLLESMETTYPGTWCMSQEKKDLYANSDHTSIVNATANNKTGPDSNDTAGSDKDGETKANKGKANPDTAKGPNAMAMAKVNPLFGQSASSVRAGILRSLSSSSVISMGDDASPRPT